jgi:hypothetical protein
MFRPSGAALRYSVGSYEHFVTLGQEQSVNRNRVCITTDY